MLGHKKWILGWQGDCTCINSILFLPNSVSPIVIHVLEQKAMKGKGFQRVSMTFIKNCDIIMLGHLSLTKKKKSCLLKVWRVIVAIKPGYSRNMSQLLISSFMANNLSIYYLEFEHFQPISFLSRHDFQADSKRYSYVIFQVWICFHLKFNFPGA